MMPKKILQGEVVSIKTNKTITVLVKRRVMHPLYKKTVNKTKKYLAHDENNESMVGDVVRIIESRPISKRKCFTLFEFVKKFAENK